MAIGENLKKICKKKGLTLKELAKLSGISVKTIYSITANDLSNISSLTMNKLCKALDIDSDRLCMDPEEYKAYMKKIDDHIRQHENDDFKQEPQRLSVTLPKGVYLIEDYEPVPGLYGYAEGLKIIYPEGTIEVTQEEIDGLKENIRRYVAFTLENFKLDHDDRLLENEKDD